MRERVYLLVQNISKTKIMSEKKTTPYSSTVWIRKVSATFQNSIVFCQNLYHLSPGTIFSPLYSTLTLVKPNFRHLFHSSSPRPQCLLINYLRTLSNTFRSQEVIRLETQYWTLVEIPKQEKQETVPSFVLRACGIVEKSQKSGEGVKSSAKLAEEDEKKRERIDRLCGKRRFTHSELCPLVVI